MVITVTDSDSAILAERLLATNLGQPDVSRVPPASAAQLTVVIPVKDRAVQLDRALAALGKLSCLVVDDGSEDPAAIEKVARHRGATYLALSRNVGPASARNAGLARVPTPFVAFVDSDVRVSETVLLGLTRHFVDPRVALVGPRVAGVAAREQPTWFEAYEEHASSLTLGTKAASVRPGAAVGWLPAACLVARTSAVASGFTADMRVGEDVDLVWRLVEEGHRVRYDPSVQVEHDTRTTIRAWLGRKFFYGTGSAILAQRHGDAVAPAVLSPWYAVAAAACLLRRPLPMTLVPLALVHAARSVEAVLPRMAGRRSIAAHLAVRGLGWAVRQEAALVLRHWWPAALGGALVSLHVRRMVVSSLVIDAAVQIIEGLSSGRPPRMGDLVARRLDDMAYGAGLWVGSLQSACVRALLPRRPGKPARPERGRRNVHPTD